MLGNKFSQIRYIILQQKYVKSPNSLKDAKQWILVHLEEDAAITIQSQSIPILLVDHVWQSKTETFLSIMVGIDVLQGLGLGFADLLQVFP